MFVCSEVYAPNKLDIYRFTQLNQKARASHYKTCKPKLEKITFYGDKFN